MRHFLFLIFITFGQFLIPNDLFAEIILNGKPRELSSSATEGKIVTDNSGRYVYVVFNTTNTAETKSSLQIRASSDFGKNFSPPIEIQSDFYSYSQIITNNNGQYVYVIWRNQRTVYTSMSEDFGKKFSPPINLNTSVDHLTFPQITTDCSGKYVYAIWKDKSGKIQMSISEESAKRWFENIELDSNACLDPQITTDRSGQYIHAIWQSGESIVTRTSSDFGNSFSSANELSYEGMSAKITTDDTGQWVYAFFQDSSNNMQIHISPDFGNRWYKTPPYQFASSGSDTTQIITNNSGKYVYCSWDDENINIVSSSDYGINYKTIELNEKGCHPFITTDSSGQLVFLTWLDKTNKIKLRLSSDFGNSFEPAITISKDADSSFIAPNIALDTKGEYFYLLWGNMEALSPLVIVNGEFISSYK